MEDTSAIDLRYNTTKYQKDVQQYDGGNWTKQGTINQVFIKDLKKHQVETYSVVQQLYKHSEKLRVAARAATEVFSDIQFLLERGGDPSDGDILGGISEKARRLAVYSFASGRTINQEAKETAAKALKLPDNVKHIAEEDREEDKNLAFTPELVERIQQARYEESILRSAVSSSSRTNSFGNYRHGSGPSRGHCYTKGYSSFKGRGGKYQSYSGKPFFGKNKPGNQTPGTSDNATPPSYHNNNQ